jgi:hypothetical protein
MVGRAATRCLNSQTDQCEGVRHLRLPKRPRLQRDGALLVHASPHWRGSPIPILQILDPARVVVATGWNGRQTTS